MSVLLFGMRCVCGGGSTLVQRSVGDCCQARDRSRRWLGQARGMKARGRSLAMIKPDCGHAGLDPVSCWHPRLCPISWATTAAVAAVLANPMFTLPLLRGEHISLTPA